MNAVKRYICILSLTAIATMSLWIYFNGFAFTWGALAISAILLPICALFRFFPLKFGKIETEVTDGVTLLALFMLGPIWALVVTVPSMLYRDRLRTTFVASCDMILICVAGFVFHLFSEPVFFTSVFDDRLVYGVICASAAFYALDATINSSLITIKYEEPFVEVVKDSFLPLIPSDFAAILAALGTSYVMITFGPAAALVLFSGAATALITLHLIHRYQRENEELKAENARLLSSSVVFAAGVVESLGAKDGYTARLAAASSVYAADLAREFDLDPERAEKLKIAALLQDVGLIGVPDEVLMSRSETLNSVGRMRLQRHTIEGEEILAKAPGLEEAAKWVRWHHERVDGTGYPDRLKSRWIPLESRVLAVAQTYASMVLDSPESPALTPDRARPEITARAERSLDPEVVKALLRILDREDENYASASDDRFTFASPMKSAGSRDFSLRVVGDA